MAIAHAYLAVRHQRIETGEYSKEYVQGDAEYLLIFAYQKT